MYMNTLKVFPRHVVKTGMHGLSHTELINMCRSDIISYIRKVDFPKIQKQGSEAAYEPVRKQHAMLEEIGFIYDCSLCSISMLEVFCVERKLEAHGN